MKDKEKDSKKKSDDKEKNKHVEAEGKLDFSDEVKRLNRVVGQVEGIKKMLEEQRKLDDVLIQCKAVHSALKSIEQRIVKTHVEKALDEIASMEKKKSRAEKVAELEELFKFVN